MKRNASKWKLLEREATLRARLTSYGELSLRTGYSVQYISNVVSRLANAKREKANNTLSEGRRYTNEQIEKFAQELRGE